MDRVIQVLTEWLKRLRPFVMIAAWEQGVRIRLGRTAALLHPGWHWILPIMDRVYVQGTQRRTVNLTMQTVTTKDGASVTVAGMVSFVISDLVQLYLSLHNVDDAVIQYGQTAIAAVVCRTAVADLDLGKIAAEVGPQVERRLKQCGLDAIDVTISDFVRAKTYRIIEGGRYGSYSDVLTLKSSVLPA